MFFFFQTVSNWNGGRAHLEREVDNERREERKRHHDPEEEEMDRGKTKKLKNHHGYESGRSNPGYNPFQEYQNGKTWNRHTFHHRQRRDYETSNEKDNRPRSNIRNHRNAYRHQQNRYQNYSRNSHYQRR